MVGVRERYSWQRYSWQPSQYFTVVLPPPFVKHYELLLGGLKLKSLSFLWGPAS